MACSILLSIATAFGPVQEEPPPPVEELAQAPVEAVLLKKNDRFC